MSLWDYKKSLEIRKKDYPFYALIMAAMRRADTHNGIKLKEAWPELWAELEARYWAPDGILPGEGEGTSGGFVETYDIDHGEGG